MLSKKRFKTKKPIFFSIILKILLLSVMGFLIVSGWRISQNRAEFYSQIIALRTEIQSLERKNRELEVGIYQIDKEYFLEKKAREKFNLKRPGEQAVIILLPEQKENEIQKQEKEIWWNPFTW